MNAQNGTTLKFLYEIYIAVWSLLFYGKWQDTAESLT